MAKAPRKTPANDTRPAPAPKPDPSLPQTPGIRRPVAGLQ